MILKTSEFSHGIDVGQGQSVVVVADEDSGLESLSSNSCNFESNSVVDDEVVVDEDVSVCVSCIAVPKSYNSPSGRRNRIVILSSDIRG